MKRFFSRALPVAALLSVAVVWAAGTTAKLSWVAPTAYTDGTPLPISDIASYAITWVPSGSTPGPAGNLTVAGNATSASVPVACGGVGFSISVTTTATAHVPNATSAPDGPVSYATGVACSVNPPTGLAAQ